MKKNDKKETASKDIVAEIEERFGRHTGVLIEKMDSTIKIVTEQYSTVAKKLDELKSDVEDLKNDMAVFKPISETNSKDMKEIKSELHSVKMAAIDTSRRVNQIDKKLDHALDNHEKRIVKLEEKVA